MNTSWMLGGMLAATLTLLARAEPAPAPAAKRMTAEEFVASLKFLQGEIKLPGGMATLNVPPNFRYLGPQDAARVLEDAWGNPKGQHPLGMLFAANVSPLTRDAWGIIITFAEDGYVSDKDADQIKYDKLLADMQASVAAGNTQRKAQGYPTLALVGWATAPRYDQATHKLFWAKELAFADNPEHTLNYNVRVLGRHGVLVLNAVAGMRQLAQIEQVMPQVVAFTDFSAGHRYADFQPGTDRLATYGIAALIAGGIAAKAGLFAKLFALLLVAKKFILLGLVAVIAFLKKILGRTKSLPAPGAE